MAAKKKAAKKKGNNRAKAPIDTFAKRSKAAKKGWATRRRNEVKKRLRTAKKKVTFVKKYHPVKKKRIEKTPHTKYKGATKKELEEQLRDAKRKLEIFEMTKDWVDAVPQEYMSRNGHIALKPSRARHLGADTEFILQRLNEANEHPDDFDFDDTCYEMASDYDMSVAEIYTLWFPP